MPRVQSGLILPWVPQVIQRLIWRLYNSDVQLAAIAIDSRISDRPYQYEAIRRVYEAFDKGQRNALIVMATGTGKTRTTMLIQKWNNFGSLPINGY